MTIDDSRAGSSMTLNEFTMTLERYGADLEHWPVDVRARAVALIAADAQVKRIWEAAQQIDSVLANLPVWSPSAALQRRVAEIPLRFPQRSAKLALPSWRLWFPTFAALMSLGVLAGFVSGGAEQQNNLPGDVPEPTAELENWVDSEDLLLALGDEIAEGYEE
jgi:hypothetical protein